MAYESHAFPSLGFLVFLLLKRSMTSKETGIPCKNRIESTLRGRFVEDGSANDSLGRSWGSRLGLAAIGGGGGSGGGGGGGGGDVQPRRASLRNDERWKKFRSAIFNRGGTSFSPKTRYPPVRIANDTRNVGLTQYPLNGEIPLIY